MFPSLILQILLLPFLSLAVFNENHLLRRQSDCPIGEISCDYGCIAIGYFCCYRGTGESCPIGSFCCSSGCCPNEDLDSTTAVSTTDKVTSTSIQSYTTNEVTSTSIQSSTTNKVTSTSIQTSPTTTMTATQQAGSDANDKNLWLQVFGLIFAATGQLLL